jgi:hypothetical protein
VIADASGGENVEGEAPLPLGEWSHLAGVYDGVSLRIYVNGKPVGNKRCPKPPSAGRGPLVIGASPNGSNRFEGMIDDVEVYNRALTETEVAAIARR